MTVRDYMPEDEPLLRELYLSRGFEGGWRPMDDVIGAVVVEDDSGTPIAFAGAHVVAEARIVIDPNFGNPKMREDAMLLAHDAAQEKVRALGFTRTMALLEGSIGRGFGKRLRRLRGWLPSRGITWERSL